MAQEASKSGPRYLRYLVGKGIDIGCGNDSIVPDAFCWDKEQGDAQLLEDLPDGLFDYVFSSHCLEHMRNPLEAILNWWRVLRPGGYMVILVPDEDLYEQGVWPSIFNDDHKNTYTLHKSATWSDTSVNLMDLVRHLPEHKLHWAQILDVGYDHTPLPEGQVKDQTVAGAEATVGIVVQKLDGPPKAGMTNLQYRLHCPTCGGEVIVRGPHADTNKNGWQIRCAKCNMVGTMQFN